VLGGSSVGVSSAGTENVSCFIYMMCSRTDTAFRFYCLGYNALRVYSSENT
jgi:hypothetical protein